MNPQQHVEHLKSMLSLSFGIPTDQITHWDSLDGETKRQIARNAGIVVEVVCDYAWAAMDDEVREKLSSSAARLFHRGTRRLQKIGRFVNSCH